MGGLECLGELAVAFLVAVAYREAGRAVCSEGLDASVMVVVLVGRDVAAVAWIKELAVVAVGERRSGAAWDVEGVTLAAIVVLTRREADAVCSGGLVALIR
jgi:hypothetical protein